MARNKHNGNGHDRVHVTETPDVSHIKNLDVTHEASDVDVAGVLKFVIALSVLGVAVFVLMWAMFRFLNAQAEKEPNPGPMAMKPEERLPPDPRLQAAKGFGVKLETGEWVNLENREPEAEYRVLREQWERQLNCQNMEGVENSNCTPINTAIDRLLAGGTLKIRPTRDDTGQATNASPPSDSSSGRMPFQEK
ncbi:MAG TPA: hypothetical protein VGW76_17225 [Pyrinomonadaceae bacterium]|nr:hypothetical protein [Pyrinomonadaceae bacterium]